MNKKLIRLTESDLHRIVRESVNRVLNEVQLNELDPRTYASAREKQKQRDAEYHKQMDDYNSKSFLHRMFNKAPEKPKGYGGRAAAFNKAAVSSFNRDYGSENNSDRNTPLKYQRVNKDGTLSQGVIYKNGDSEVNDYDFKANRGNGVVTTTRHSQPLKNDFVTKRGMNIDDITNPKGTYFDKGRKVASDMSSGVGKYEKGKGWRNF